MARCKLPACPVAKDGRCLEGRGPACPNLVPDALDDHADTPPAGGSGRQAAEELFQRLPGVMPLNADEARYFSRRGRAVVVSLAGMRESGKTSLLARLHQLFLSEPVAGFDFAGSRSLPRLEELNWHATVESCVSQPTMPRSSSQFDNSYVHVSVRHSSGGPRIDVLLNDISGETFKEAVSSQGVCDKLLGLSRADHLVTLVDGGAIADRGKREHHIGLVRDFLQRVVQQGQCGRHTGLHLVISKLDKLKGNLGRADEVEHRFRSDFIERFGSFSTWRVAARPMDGSMPTVEPIAQLFEAWIRTTHRYPVPQAVKFSPGEWPRDFCRYQG